jgi:hypothetical protein
MDTINHFESEIPCYRVAHDGEQVVSVTFASGKTSSKHQIITGDSWEDVVEKLGEQEIAIGDAFIPEPEPEPDID